MTDIMELRAKRANLWEAAKAFLDTHTGKDGKQIGRASCRERV